MARWVPPANVEANEQIGRRLFDEPLLAGSAGQPSFSGLLLTHFEETRGDDFSVDRLGKSGLDKKVIFYLKPRAEAAGKLFTKTKRFDGWAVISAREITKNRKRAGFKIVACPVNDPVPNDNLYHAHICRPADVEPEYMALRLRHLFTTYGKIEAVAPPDINAHWWDGISTILQRFIRIFGL